MHICSFKLLFVRDKSVLTPCQIAPGCYLTLCQYYVMGKESDSFCVFLFILYNKMHKVALWIR